MKIFRNGKNLQDQLNFHRATESRASNFEILIWDFTTKSIMLDSTAGRWGNSFGGVHYLPFAWARKRRCCLVKRISIALLETPLKERSNANGREKAANEVWEARNVRMVADVMATAMISVWKTPPRLLTTARRPYFDIHFHFAAGFSFTARNFTENVPSDSL